MLSDFVNITASAKVNFGLIIWATSYIVPLVDFQTYILKAMDANLALAGYVLCGSIYPSLRY